MENISVIQGGEASDFRGKLSFANDFHMDEVRRFYLIRNADTSTIRAWHAHQFEKKWFYLIQGAATLAFVKIDHWEGPSPDLKPEIFSLTADDNKIICIPEGYANGIKTHTPDTIIMVYSNKILEDALQDSWRYDKNRWMKWDK